eukprot:1418142-Rhodomonas_salina.1
MVLRIRYPVSETGVGCFGAGTESALLRAESAVLRAESAVLRAGMLVPGERQCSNFSYGGNLSCPDPMKFLAVSPASCLRACYAVSGTETAYGASSATQTLRVRTAKSSRAGGKSAIGLRACYCVRY